jgi:hypothetical protein
MKANGIHLQGGTLLPVPPFSIGAQGAAYRTDILNSRDLVQQAAPYRSFFFALICGLKNEYPLT